MRGATGVGDGGREFEDRGTDEVGEEVGLIEFTDGLRVERERRIVGRW